MSWIAKNFIFSPSPSLQLFEQVAKAPFSNFAQRIQVALEPRRVLHLEECRGDLLKSAGVGEPLDGVLQIHPRSC